MSSFDLDRMLALVRRIDAVGLDRRAQERWTAYRRQVKDADGAWLGKHFEVLLERIHEATKIRVRSLTGAGDAERLRAAFWLAIWLYRAATRRPVNLVELVHAVRDLDEFLRGLQAAPEGQAPMVEGALANPSLRGPSAVAARRARWEAIAHRIWSDEPALRDNATATARRIVAAMEVEGETSPGSVNTVRRFVATLARAR